MYNNAPEYFATLRQMYIKKSAASMHDSTNSDSGSSNSISTLRDSTGYDSVISLHQEDVAQVYSPFRPDHLRISAKRGISAANPALDRLRFMRRSSSELSSNLNLRRSNTSSLNPLSDDLPLSFETTNLFDLNDYPLFDISNDFLSPNLFADDDASELLPSPSPSMKTVSPQQVKSVDTLERSHELDLAFQSDDEESSVEQRKHLPSLQEIKALVRPFEKKPKSPDKIPRPLNAFMLYRVYNSVSMAAAYKEFKESSKKVAIQGKQIEISMSKFVAKKWSEEPLKVKLHYENLAEEEKIWHKTVYPNYKYRPTFPSASSVL